MESVICKKEELVAIADAIREINGDTRLYAVRELPQMIVLSQLSGFTVSHDGAGNVTLTLEKE